MAVPDKQPDAAPRPAGQIEERIRSARDSLPGRRDSLPKGELGGLPPDPQADENREPPAGAPTIPGYHQ
jgi:hypothetical protein